MPHEYINSHYSCVACNLTALLSPEICQRFHQIEYPAASVVQMRFLRLHSRRVEQRVTFSCPPGHRLGQTRREAKFMTDVSKQSYLATIQDCVVRSFIVFSFFAFVCLFVCLFVLWSFTPVSSHIYCKGVWCELCIVGIFEEVLKSKPNS